MGWGCPTKTRNEFLKECITLKEPKKFYAVVTDMCGKSRQHACGKTPRNAKVVANGLCKSLWKRATHLVVMMFDDPEKIHPIRNVLHSKRYRSLSAEKQKIAEEKGKVIYENQAYDRDLVPYTRKQVRKFTVESDIMWRKLWPTAYGKSKAFKLIRDACVLWHHKNMSGESKLVVWDHEYVLTYPYNCTDAAELGRVLCNNTGGEADTKTAEAAKAINSIVSESCLIDTIDTDMILQMTASYELEFANNNSLFLRLMNETVDIRALTRLFGYKNIEQRLSSVFWMVSLGCDYCTSLTRFGFNGKELLRLASPLECKEIFEIDMDAGVATFNTWSFVHAIKQIRRRNVKGRSFDELNKELHNILFCVSYFSGADKNRIEYAGPDVTSGNLILINETFSEASFASLNQDNCINQQIKIIR